MSRLSEYLGAKPRRAATIVMTLIVALAVAVAGLALKWNETSEDMNAKYRAQYVTVMDFSGFAPRVGRTIDLMLSGSSIHVLPNATYESGSWHIEVGARYAYGDLAAVYLERLSTETISISVMYESGTERNEVFSNLSDRLGVFEEAVWAGMSKLNSWNSSLSINYTSEMENASAALDQIGQLLQDGVEPGVDALRRPYDILAGVDLVEIDHYTDEMWSAAWYASHSFEVD